MVIGDCLHGDDWWQKAEDDDVSNHPRAEALLRRLCGRKADPHSQISVFSYTGVCWSKSIFRMFSCFLFILWNSFTFTAWESRGCFIQRNSNRYFRTWPWVQSYSQSQLFRLNISLEAPFIWSSSFLNKSRCLSQLDYTAHFWKAFVTRCFRAIISDHYPDTFQETFPFPIS